VAAGFAVVGVVLGACVGFSNVNAQQTSVPLPGPTELARASGPTQPGEPFEGLSAAERERYERGRVAFERVRSLEDGLGPVFNDVACNRCHNRKGVGGEGIQFAILAGRFANDVFDPLLAQGGPLFASATVMLDGPARRSIPNCKLPRDGEPLPPEANVVVRRRTTALFGLGLVDATPDATFIALAEQQPTAIRGRAALVQNRSSGGRSVGKFGWKAQAPSLHQFAGMALSLELGVTNPQFATEQPPLGNAALLAGCDPLSDLEDDGEEVRRLTDFMQRLAPIPPLPSSPEARAGDVVFTQIGCDGCHVRRITSGPSPIAALSQQHYAPFSDFLLHDMGALGDNIGGEGDASPREMRTAPLWGGHLLGGSRLLHDGRAKSFSLAIEQHDGQGAAARNAFRDLSETQRRQLLAFLATL
jgi:CxxC motif-containing protein (DUF1111 family)